MTFLITDGYDNDEELVELEVQNPSERQVIEELKRDEICYGTHFILRTEGLEDILAICVSSVFLKAEDEGDFLYYNRSDDYDTVTRQTVIDRFKKEMKQTTYNKS